jgi:hypothetical protein
MAAGISEIADKIVPGDTFLFFFSGHGLSPDNTNLFLPSDLPAIHPREPGAALLVRKSSFSEADIISTIQHKLTETATGEQKGVIIPISDACRNNPFPDTGPDLTRSWGYLTLLPKLNRRQEYSQYTPLE